MTIAHRAVYGTIKGLSRILCRVDDAQLARVPRTGPLIIVANHVNFLDAPVVYSHLQPRPVTGFAKIETWDSPFLGPLFSLGRAIPLSREQVDLHAMRRAFEVLQAGYIMAVAPEGARSGHGCLQEGYPGVVFLALRTGAPVLPIAYYGGELFWGNIKRLRRTDFHIVVGRPFRLEANGERVTRAVRRQMVDEIMYQIAALLPDRYRGVYSDLSAATERYLRFAPGVESDLRQGTELIA